jgi:hypothetical protein
MYYNLICIFLYALLFAQNFILVKSGCYRSGGGVAAHCRLLACTLDRGGGGPGVYVGRVEVQVSMLDV